MARVLGMCSRRSCEGKSRSVEARSLRGLHEEVLLDRELVHPSALSDSYPPSFWTFFSLERFSWCSTVVYHSKSTCTSQRSGLTNPWQLRFMVSNNSSKAVGYWQRISSI